jgi:mono/diheme cytochrome c family protein
VAKRFRTLLACVIAGTALPALALDIAGPTNEFTVHDGGWYLYKRNCSGCHGFRGEGTFPIGPPLRGNKFVQAARAQDIAAVVRNGLKDDTKRYPQYLREANGYMNMPPFTELSISNSELDKLIKYLKGPFQQGKYNNP